MNLTTPVVPAKLVNGADTAWIMISTVLVFIMVQKLKLRFKKKKKLTLSL